ncbi:HAD-IA family hydrolase [Streptococcus sp. zg-JUN1979]|uniref:HAD-IA family hydrolase n=1 Tax=Streptococcus sp. zg-JUN1979 TaxID=3391450 RepID=UPI0039A4B2CD
MHYEDYIWDLGGTLLDNYEISTKAFVETLSSFGIKASHDEVYHYLKCSTDAAIRQFIPEEPRFLPLYKQAEKKQLEHPILFDGARAILERIVREGSRNFLVSHRDNQVMSLLDKMAIASYFTEVVTADNGFLRKPDPESFLYLKEKYHITNALVIGDREIDSQAGSRAGFATLLVDGKKSLMEIIK